VKSEKSFQSEWNRVFGDPSIEVVKSDYNKIRHLEFQPLSNLLDRLSWVVTNLFQFENGKNLSLIGRQGNTKFVWWAFEDIVSELRIRGIRPPSHLVSSEGQPIPFTLFGKNLKRAIRLWGKIGVKPKAYRFSQKKYLEDFLNDGLLRITPASDYKDDVQNPARQDDELGVQLLRHPSQIKITHHNPRTGEDTEIVPISDTRMQSTFATNYYTLCLANKYDPRMFDAFKADACLLIDDPERLTELINEAIPIFRPGLGQTWPVKVNYMDYENPHKEPVPTLTKDIKYSFQSEVRLNFFRPPPWGMKNIKPFFVQLKGVKDFCRLVKV
jgi:hypothetical protein